MLVSSRVTLSSLVAILLIVVFGLPTTSTLVSVTAFAAEGSESPPESSPTSTSSDDSGDGAGSHRGHETTRMKALTQTTLKWYMTTERKKKGQLLSWEKEFLCAIAKTRVGDRKKAKVWFPDYLAEVLGRPVSMVLKALRDPACPSPTRYKSWIQ